MQLSLSWPHLFVQLLRFVGSSFHQVGMLPAAVSLSPLSGTPAAGMVACFVGFTSHWGSAHRSSLFVFLLLWLSNLTFLIFKLAAASSYSALLLNPSAISFIIHLFVLSFTSHCICFPAPGFPCRSFFQVLSLLLVSVPLSLSWLCRVALEHLLLSEPRVWASSGICSLDLFCPFEQLVLSCFFFVVEN